MSTRAPWYTRLAQTLGLAAKPEPVERSTGPLPIVEPVQATFSAGADFAAGVASPPVYSPRQAVFGAVASPFYGAAIDRLAHAVATLPVVAEREVRRGTDYEAERVASQAVDLLRAPGGGRTRLQLMRQLAVDLLTTGNAYVLPLSVSPGGPPVVLKRLHPARVTIEPGADGAARAYVYDEQGRLVYYPPEQVIHAKTWSADDGQLGLYGVGLTQRLHAELVADQALAERARRNGVSGRPAAVLSPKGEPWNRIQQEEASRAVKTMVKDADGGVLVLSGEATLSPLAWTPAEQAVPEARGYLREQVMAVTGVPPTVMGLPGANFATAQQEARLFWQSVQRVGDDLLDALSALCAMFGEPPGTRLRLDTSGIAELQPDRLPRVETVAQWVALGADPDEAARYEGFADAPDLSGPEAPAPAGPQAPAQPEAPAGPALSPDDAADLAAQARAVLSGADEDEPDAVEVLTDAADLARMVLEALGDDDGADA